MSAKARRRTARVPDFAAGALVIAVVAIGVFLAFTKVNPFSHPYRLKAVFSSALSNGIHANAPVRIAGVNVGKVKGVQRGPGTTVLVTMTIQKSGLPIHSDATIKARPRLFLEGNYFLELRPGTPDMPDLKAGATVPLTQTAVPVQFDQMLSTYSADSRHSFQNLLGGLSTALKAGGSRALRANFRRAPGALKSTAVALEAMRGTEPGDLAGLIRQQASLNTTLDAHRVALQGLITGFRRTMDAFAAEQDALGATFPALNRLLVRTPATIAAVDAALPPLRRLSVALRPGLKAAPPVLDEALPFLRALDSLTRPDRLDRLVRELGPTVSGLQTLEGSLPPLLRIVQPVSQCVRTRIVPVLDASVPDGALSNGRPVWQEAQSLATGLLSSQQNFGGNGYSQRYSFSLGADTAGVRLPGPGDLFQLTGSEQLGSRPLFTNHQPQPDPDADCLKEPLTSLVAATAPPPPGQRHVIIPGVGR